MMFYISVIAVSFLFISLKPVHIKKCYFLLRYIQTVRCGEEGVGFRIGALRADGGWTNVAIIGVTADLTVDYVII